jgi:hypothetical protein
MSRMVSSDTNCYQEAAFFMLRVGQNHIYTVYVRYLWQGDYHIYGHIRCIYTVLANPTHIYGSPLASLIYAARHLNWQSVWSL